VTEVRAMGRGRRRQRIKTGVPGRRRGDALNVGLEPGEDGFHDLKGFHYEWWYFHAAFEDGHSVVAILWPMNYSKPWRRQCTIQLSIAEPGGKLAKHYIFPDRRLFSASRERCDVRIGNSYARDTGAGYQIHVEAEGDSVDLLFEPTLPGWKPGTAVNHVWFPRFNSMGWLVPVPAARVRGHLEVAGRRVEVKGGHGYHDHNWGEAPITHVVDNWHWGHVVCGDVVIIWSDITMCEAYDYDKTYMFLLALGDRLVMESPELAVSYGDWRADTDYLHPYPGRITVAFGDDGTPARGEFSMSVRQVVETQDLLEMTGLPRRLEPLVHRTIGKPYYFRWRSEVAGWLETEDDERAVLSGETIHEQMLFRGRHPSECMRLAGGGPTAPGRSGFA
jgi:hypothetical protein